MDYEVVFNGRTYRHLAPRPDSHYKQFFYKNKKIFAETLHRATLGEDAQTPDQVAADYDVPVEAVLEAIAFCEENQDVLRADHERTDASIRAAGLDKPTHVSPAGVPEP